MLRALIVACAFALALFASGEALASSPPPGAAALESRLNAPCCYGGTLDVHESELARELRKEIEGRLARGEASDSIQADFVARYGERVLAARSDKPIAWMGLSLVALLAAAAAGLGWTIRRWIRAAKSIRSRPASDGPTQRDELDDRIDEELADPDAEGV